MGFFSGSGGNLDAVDKDCQAVALAAGQIRDKVDRSLRGKYEMMQPEERATLLKDALALHKKLVKSLESARENQGKLEKDKPSSEETIQAHGKLLAASLDAQRAQKALEEGRKSLAEGLTEVESFFGASSREAKHVRKVIAELEAGG